MRELIIAVGINIFGRSGWGCLENTNTKIFPSITLNI